MDQYAHISFPIMIPARKATCAGATPLPTWVHQEPVGRMQPAAGKNRTLSSGSGCLSQVIVREKEFNHEKPLSFEGF